MQRQLIIFLSPPFCFLFSSETFCIFLLFIFIILPPRILLMILAVHTPSYAFYFCNLKKTITYYIHNFFPFFIHYRFYMLLMHTIFSELFIIFSRINTTQIVYNKQFFQENFVNYFSFYVATSQYTFTNISEHTIEIVSTNFLLHPPFLPSIYFPASSTNICCVFSFPDKLLSVLCSGIKAMIANAITNNYAAILIRLLFPMVSYSFPLHATFLLTSR